MKVEIKNRFSGEIISGEYKDIKECVKVNRANLYGADLAGLNLAGANLYRANLAGANLAKTNLSEANLYGADLAGANLAGANLSGTDLSGTDLYGANLSGANLSGANLSGTDLSGLISISGTKDKFQYYKGFIKIACIYKTVKDWLNNYKEIGEKHGYTNEEIKEYGRCIKFCAEMEEKDA